MEKFSYSKLSTYEQCGYRYKLQYIDKNFIDGGGVATEVGTLIHETEENILNQIKDNLFGLFIDYKSLIENIKTKFKEIKEKYPDDIKQEDKSGRTYQEKIEYYITEGIYRLETFFKDNPSLEPVAAEKEFNLEYNGYIFHGFIDRIFYNKETGKYIIEDIKTYAVPLEDGALKTPLQFVFYTKALMDMMNLNEDEIECSYDLPFCNVKQHAGTKGFLKRGFVKIDKLLNEISENKFEPKPTPLCHWCVFSHTYPNQPEKAKGLCPYFSHWTKDKKDFTVEYEWMGEENHTAILEAFKKKLLSSIIEDVKTAEIAEITKPKIIEVSDSERRFIIRR